MQKYVIRNSPPYPANNPGCIGKILLGNDHRLYKSIATKNGIYRWKPVIKKNEQSTWDETQKRPKSRDETQKRSKNRDEQQKRRDETQKRSKNRDEQQKRRDEKQKRSKNRDEQQKQMGKH